MSKYDDGVHGSAYDRGSADSYYRRPRSPHFWPEGSYNGKKVEAKDMTPEQIDAYNEGFDDNEDNGDFKDWGGYDLEADYHDSYGDDDA